MTDISKEALEEILAVAETDEDAAIRMILEATVKDARPGPESEDNAPTIPDDPDLSHIRYLSMLRRALKGRHPDPIVLVAMDALMRKYGYPILAKLIAKLARKMRFQLQTKDTEILLQKYGKVVVPIMAVIFIDILKRYQQLSQEQTTIKDPSNS